METALGTGSVYRNILITPQIRRNRLMADACEEFVAVTLGIAMLVLAAALLLSLSLTASLLLFILLYVFYGALASLRLLQIYFTCFTPELEQERPGAVAANDRLDRWKIRWLNPVTLPLYLATLPFRLLLYLLR